MPSRRQAREAALQTLYAIAVGHRDPGDALAELAGADETEYRAFVKDLVLGTLDHAQEVDALLSPLLEGWTIERLPTIDRLLLEMGAFELRHRPQTPRAVVINEAVELAKRFSTEDSNRFVNGVLNAIAKETTQA
ncbi:MAG TPA: transcription antitermination factor NusB [Candidatus Acidoferrales bacterium]|nr:transcription antitermination factor NusB [Candidatus Acidoferrales bacterium]